MKTGSYYSAGKLLLSGEYLVLHGAKALAVPLKLGHRMNVIKGGKDSIIQWKTNVLGKEWFSCRFLLPDFEIIESSDQKTGEFLKTILLACSSLNPDDLSSENSYKIQSDLEFDIRWGLGSSSSLVSNLAWWLNIDPYLLFKKVFPGSGYDVFCARAKKPILFQLKRLMPLCEEAAFNPSFRDHLYFVYLGNKQDSQKSVIEFKSSSILNDKDLKEISSLTEQMITCDHLEDFMRIMNHHEEILSSILKLKKIGEERFHDFRGAVKSLGAWGGDFVMAAALEPESEARKYFSERGYDVFFRYDELAAGF